MFNMILANWIFLSNLMWSWFTFEHFQLSMYLSWPSTPMHNAGGLSDFCCVFHPYPCFFCTSTMAVFPSVFPFVHIHNADIGIWFHKLIECCFFMYFMTFLIIRLSCLCDMSTCFTNIPLTLQTLWQLWQQSLVWIQLS